MRLRDDYKAICFDMDGTLLDTDIDYEKLGNAECFVLQGLGVPLEKINTHSDEASMIREGVRYLNENGNVITFDDVCRLVNRRASEIELECVPSAECFPGVRETLADLKGSGFRIGLLTRGQRDYAVAAMGTCGILGFMDAIEAFNDHPTGEQKPNPVAMEHLAKKLGVVCEDILYIGDSIWDYECARDSGAGFVGICPENKRPIWERKGENMLLVDDFTELIGLL